jgi:hypothetical protein
MVWVQFGCDEHARRQCVRPHPHKRAWAAWAARHPPTPVTTMKASLALALAALAPVASAYPWLAGAGAPPSQPEERDLISGIIGTVAGLLGSVAAGVNPSDKRPDAAHPFIAPGPTDQRGPCPALNVLANHGYLPRSGIVTAGQVIEATSEGFNMAADLSSLLVAIAVGTGGNIDTFTFSIGGEDNRTYTPTGVGSRAAGRQFGLDKHSACECDASATKQDFFLNDGSAPPRVGRGRRC